MSKILITGGAGFIGSSLANELAKDQQNEVVIVDNLSTGSEKNIPNRLNCAFIKADVNEMDEIEAVMDSHRFDYVFHYAAVVGVKRTQENPLSVLRDIDGIKNIFELCQRTKVKRIFFSSSSEVYGEPVELPQNESTTPLNSRLPYSIVKNLGESFCKTYQKEHGLDYTIFRFFNTYSPKQTSDFVVSKFVRAAIINEDIGIYGIGEQSRTFCYIDDNIKATLNALKKNQFINDVVNIGSDVIVTINELAQTVIKSTNSSSKVKYLPALEDGDMTRRQPDISKMKILLDREPITLTEGIDRFLEYYEINGKSSKINDSFTLEPKRTQL